MGLNAIFSTCCIYDWNILCVMSKRIGIVCMDLSIAVFITANIDVIAAFRTVRIYCFLKHRNVITFSDILLPGMITDSTSVFHCPLLMQSRVDLDGSSVTCVLLYINGLVAPFALVEVILLIGVPAMIIRNMIADR